MDLQDEYIQLMLSFKELKEKQDELYRQKRKLETKLLEAQTPFKIGMVLKFKPNKKFIKAEIHHAHCYNDGTISYLIMSQLNTGNQYYFYPAKDKITRF